MFRTILAAGMGALAGFAVYAVREKVEKDGVESLVPKKIFGKKVTVAARAPSRSRKVKSRTRNRSRRKATVSASVTKNA